MTTTQTELGNLFKSLHTKGEPLILFNVWDAGSARAVCSGRFGMPSLFWPDAYRGSHPSSRSHWQNLGLPWPAFPGSTNLSRGRGSRLEVLMRH